MGVQGLWDLLAPVGRRVSVETLSGKKLAIDASIWMVQFMKAMRDEKGEMVRHAHLIGFFRRICKLLFLRTRPVFVFDGGTPALKRRTVIARRRRRENAQANIRKTAEKLLLNQLKAMRLKELAKDLEEQRKDQKKASNKGNVDDPKGKRVMLNESEGIEDYDREKLDEMLAASIAAEEEGRLISDAVGSSAAFPGRKGEESDEDEEIILPSMDGSIDPAILAALPPSIQLDLLMRSSSMAGNMQQPVAEEDNVAVGGDNQENLDEMLVASLLAEEDTSVSKSIPAVNVPSDEEGGEEDEEIILPEVQGRVDPAVLAALPPSMQLDLLVQMRERLMAENRQRYQKVKKAPARFSELQIEAYLKTVAFRREIDIVQKAAAGKGVGGVQTSRIASEANREFIFSSSFTGDKQLLTTGGVQSPVDKQQQTQKGPPSDSVASVPVTNKSNAGTGFVLDESPRVFEKDVETYLDERGRIRVSRVRAMGMRMTRDLQRNLDLMKEIEQERTHLSKSATAQSVVNKDKTAVANSLPNENQDAESSYGNNGDSNIDERNGYSFLNNEKSVEISFEVEDKNQSFDSDDEIFAGLVAGQPVAVSAVDKCTSKRHSAASISEKEWEGRQFNVSPIGIRLEANPSNNENNTSDDSEVEWEEDAIQEKGNHCSSDIGLKTKPSDIENNVNDDSVVEREKGTSDIHEVSSKTHESGTLASRGFMEEEADLQEAIRRSLQDLGDDKPDHSSENKRSQHPPFRNIDQDYNADEQNVLGKDVILEYKLSSDALRVVNQDSVGQISISQPFPSTKQKTKSSEAHNSDSSMISLNKSSESCPQFDLVKKDQEMNKGNLCREMPAVQSVADQSTDTFLEDNRLSISGRVCLRESSNVPETKLGDLPNDGVSENIRNENEAGHLTDKEKIGPEAENSCQLLDNDTSIPLKDPSAKVSSIGTFVVEKSAEGPSRLVDEKKIDAEAEESFLSFDYPSTSLKEPSTKVSSDGIVVDQNSAEGNSPSHEWHMGGSAARGDGKMGADSLGAALEEEMTLLGQECRNLEDEQRKLERNAESVSSEMFQECQELLQMFGLPYIIAPMEAEAQCAYMELANLVDGVVTDDSDVFLFGGRSVYKNLFDDRKYVETYFMKDIEKELGLTREKLIRMALLLGSDYTEGISGIGIVNAIEVVNAFPEEDGLQKFREWVESPDPTILGKFDEQPGLSGRKKSKVGDLDSNCSNNSEGLTSSDLDISNDPVEKQSVDHNKWMKQIFMDQHRNVSKNWHIPSSFPSEAVISAYACPQVDKSTEPFTWGRPDLSVLRRLCWEKFGWNIQKSDELLQPVLNEYNKHETQLRLEAFYTFNERFAKIRSKRIKKAIKGITRNQSSDLIEGAEEATCTSRKKSRVSRGESGHENTVETMKRTAEKVPGNMDNSMKKSTPSHSRKRKNAGEPLWSELDSRRGRRRGCTNKALSERGRVRGKGKGHGMGRQKQSDSSSDDVNDGDDEQELLIEKSDGPQELRMSMRSRKPASYAVDDSDQDDDRNFNNETAGNEKCGYTEIELNGEDIHKKDPSQEGPLSQDYLQTGGEFCTEEGRVGDVGQNINPLETDFGKDYLKLGGGFCVNESDKDKDQAAGHGQPTADTSCSGSREEADLNSGPAQSIPSITTSLNTFDSQLNVSCVNSSIDPSKVNVSLPHNSLNDIEISSVVLSAMPSLRRKRRKS